jgi:hypothetical protein
MGGTGVDGSSLVDWHTLFRPRLRASSFELQGVLWWAQRLNILHSKRGHLTRQLPRIARYWPLVDRLNQHFSEVASSPIFNWLSGESLPSVP